MRSPRRARLGGVLAAALALSLVAAGVPAGAIAAPACDAPPTEVIRTSATVDRPLTTRFARYGDTAGRWTGADSAYSVKLPGGRIAWLYSDTFMGTVNADRSRPADSPFIHNSIVISERGSLTTHTGGTTNGPESLAKVPGGDEQQNWYWFGDGTVEGNHLRVTLLEFRKTGDQPFDFAFESTAIASFSLSDMHLESITDRPNGALQWGSAIYEDDV